MDEEEKKVRFSDFSALWEEEWGKGRMSWGGKGDWVVIGSIFALLVLCQILDCTDKMPLKNWFRYFFIAAGLIWLVGGVIRFLVPQWRRPLPGLFFPGYAFCTLGIMLAFGWKMWPVIAVAVGLFAMETIIYQHFRKKMLEEKRKRYEE
ncbi:hypothetical protein JXM67_04635 [candidate division WOR-3 bacterium]|nr:hypothetical protein [candidate division WOR-3 bacterium]